MVQLLKQRVNKIINLNQNKSKNQFEQRDLRIFNMTSKNNDYFYAFNFFKNIFFHTETEKTQKETIQSAIFKIFFTIWDNRFTIGLDTTFVIAITMILYVLWKKLNKLEQADTKPSNKNTSPTIYNNTMSIHVWLNELSEYLESNKLKTVKQKQEAILEKLVMRSKNVIKKLIENKVINNYNDL